MPALRNGLLTLLLASLCAPALSAPKKQSFIAPDIRTSAPEPRATQVFVPQAEIRTEIVDSKVAMAAGGGLLMALIDAGVNSARAKRAEATVQPIRQVLTGFDADALAVSTTDATLARLSWLGAQAAGSTKDNTLPSKMTLLDAASTTQSIWLEYDYGMSPDFSAVVVSATIQIPSREPPAGKKPEARADARNMVFLQSVRSVQVLASPDKEPEVNAGRWAQDNGALARTALEAGFARVGALAEKALMATAADLDTWKKIKGNTTLGGHSGKQVEQADNETLLFDGSLISVHVIAPQ